MTDDQTAERPDDTDAVVENRSYSLNSGRTSLESETYAVGRVSRTSSAPDGSTRSSADTSRVRTSASREM